MVGPSSSSLVLNRSQLCVGPHCVPVLVLFQHGRTGNRKGLLDHIHTKKYFGVVTARDASQRFCYLMKYFFLKSLEQPDTDFLFATIPLCYSLFGVACTKGVE